MSEQELSKIIEDAGYGTRANRDTSLMVQADERGGFLVFPSFVDLSPVPVSVKSLSTALRNNPAPGDKAAPEEWIEAVRRVMYELGE